MSQSELKNLQELLKRFSNGVWEHGEGIVIENLDNPGWSIRVALNDTPFEALTIDARFDDRSDDDWIHLQTIQRGHDRFLELHCGPENLEEALSTVLRYLS